MKYVCTRKCFVPNAKGRMQLFERGDVEDFGSRGKVSEHFMAVDASGQVEEKKSGVGKKAVGKTKDAAKS